MPKRSRQKIRNDMKKVLGNLDKRWVRAASVELSKLLSDLIENTLTADIDIVLAWTSFFPGEVDLSHFISQQLEKREVYLPRSSLDYKMTFVSIGKNWLSQVQEGEYGIPEPKLSSGNVLEIEDASRIAVIVPGVSFDKYGNRIGRGKGYYDRFLGQGSLKAATKIGVFWNMQLRDALPVESHDVPMNWLCSEEQISAVSPASQVTQNLYV